MGGGVEREVVETFDPTPASLRPGTARDGLLHAYASALADWVNYFWDRHILTYGLGDQIALAIDLIDRARLALRAATLALHSTGLRNFGSLMAVLVVAGIAVVLLARRRRSLFDLLAIHLASLGIEVGPSMTMEEALVQLRSMHPAAARELAPLIEMYEAERFSAADGEEAGGADSERADVDQWNIEC